MDRRIEAAVEIMHRDAGRRVQIRELAHQVNLSPDYFSRLFKSEMSLSPNQYARCWRLQRAKEMLDHSFLKVHEVAAQVGFRHLSSFTREFKRLYGHTPSLSRGKGVTKPSFLLQPSAALTNAPVTHLALTSGSNADKQGPP